MESDKEEKNYSGNSLNRVEPVSRIRVIQVVRPRFDCDHQTVNSMVDKRNENSTNFYEQYVRNGLEILNGVIEIRWTCERFRVRIKMFEEKNAKRHNAG